MIIHKNTLVRIDWLAEAHNRWWKLRRARRKEIMIETAKSLDVSREDHWRFDNTVEGWFITERVVRPLYRLHDSQHVVWREGVKTLAGWQPPANSY